MLPGRAPSVEIQMDVGSEQLVEGVEEWPIDLPTVLRAGGYVVLPVVSWFSGSVAPDAIVRVLAVLIR